MFVFWRNHVRCFAIPKCASSSISVAFGSRANYTELDGGPNCPAYRFTGIFVRHPLARLVSLWENLVSKKQILTGLTLTHEQVKDFPTFVRSVNAKVEPPVMNLHIRDQVLAIKKYLRISDSYFMGRVEELDIDWRRFSKACGIQLDPIGHYRRTQHLPWETYYDEVLREETETRFCDDLDMWLDLEVPFDPVAR